VNIGFIVISIITAAFIPVISKKLKNSDLSISTGVDYNFDENFCNTVKENCSVCSGSECVRCKEGYYLEDESCVKCSDNCKICNPTKGCSECDSGYYSDGKACKSCPLGCKTCTGASSCAECEIGYFKQGSSCMACKYHCAKCSNEDICEICSEGYTLSSVNKCFKYECSGKICVLTDYKDSKLSIYRRGLGDLGGPDIPSGISVCEVDTPCTPASQNLCLRSNVVNGHYTADTTFCSHASKTSSYSGCTRTMCNWYAGNYAAKTFGWRLINASDINLFSTVSLGYGNTISDPFMSSGPDALGLYIFGKSRSGCTYLNSFCLPERIHIEASFKTDSGDTRHGYFSETHGRVWLAGGNYKSYGGPIILVKD